MVLMSSLIRQQVDRVWNHAGLHRLSRLLQRQIFGT